MTFDTQTQHALAVLFVLLIICCAIILASAIAWFAVTEITRWWRAERHHRHDARHRKPAPARLPRRLSIVPPPSRLAIEAGNWDDGPALNIWVPPAFVPAPATGTSSLAGAGRTTFTAWIRPGRPRTWRDRLRGLLEDEPHEHADLLPPVGYNLPRARTCDRPAPHEQPGPGQPVDAEFWDEDDDRTEAWVHDLNRPQPEFHPADGWMPVTHLDGTEDTKVGVVIRPDDPAWIEAFWAKHPEYAP
ncbi:MAG TPA: hypothetical protein VF506_14550 [Streptosporangiaceae bacterium]